MMKTFLISIINWFISNKIIDQLNEQIVDKDKQIKDLIESVNELEEDLLLCNRIRDQLVEKTNEQQITLQSYSQKLIDAINLCSQIKDQSEQKINSITDKYNTSKQRVSLLELKLQIRPKN